MFEKKYEIRVRVTHGDEDMGWAVERFYFGISAHRYLRQLNKQKLKYGTNGLWEFYIKKI